MTIYFTSDLHLGHKNIIEYTGRPYKNIDEMDEVLISNWNARVTAYDEVYILGDVALCPVDRAIQCLRRMNGIKYLVEGNHDYRNLKNPEFKSQFVWVKPIFELELADDEVRKGRRRIVMCHYAMRVWNKSHHGSYHLYGHSHGSLPDDPNALSMDVGVDARGYVPVSIHEVHKLMSKKNWKPIDHHRYRGQE